MTEIQSPTQPPNVPPTTQDPYTAELALAAGQPRPIAGDLDASVFAVSRIAAVPRILEVICRTTGMGFAAVPA